MMALTSLRDSKRIDGSVRPAMPWNRFVPVQCNGGALWEDDGGVDQTCKGVEDNKGPEEGLPSFAGRTVTIRSKSDLCSVGSSQYYSKNLQESFQE